ncbi:hypothetical protein AB1L88_25715 [Tautonia sp. JC769]|uniref:hypothetical protein n=1 Tax=Tautonia sp. JC769 TaxID=3232135 RepID=UPI0034577D2D
MRPIASLILILILVLCPIVCGASDSVCAASLIGALTDTVDPDRGADPDCCPGEGNSLPQDAGNCLCKGAVQADGPRADAGNHDGLPLILDGTPLDNPHFPSRPLAHLTRSGSPTGWAAWGCASRVRAVLQNFRC